MSKSPKTEALLSIADISRHFSLPESTTRYYCKRFAAYIPSVGEGRRRRYRSETLDVIQAILDQMQKSRTAVAVDEALQTLFPRNAEDVAGLTNPRFTIQSSSATISEILAGGEGAYKVENATVMAVTQRSFVIQDATGAILVFRGYNKEIPEVGSVVTLDGQVTTFNQALQFDASATVTKTGTTTVTEPSATEVNASNIQSIIDANKVVFVKLPGELFKDGDYYNMTLPFDSSHTGSIDAPAESLNIDSYLNQMVDAYGWFIYTTGSGARFTIAATKFVANTTTPSVKFDKTSLSFAATGAEPQTVGFTAQNITGSVDMDIVGTDADKFSITAQDASSVTVSVAGDNTTDAAFTAQLVAKVGSETLATVELKQSKSNSGTGSDTKGIYESMSEFIPTSGSTTSNPGLLDGSTANGENCTGFKLGTSSKVGTFTSAALNVTGSKKLGFYAVGWKGSSDTELTITVDNGGTANVTTFSLTGNNGATGNPPFTLTPSDETDYYVVELSDLTAASTITFKTTVASKGRAVVFGVQLF